MGSGDGRRWDRKGTVEAICRGTGQEVATGASRIQASLLWMAPGCASVPEPQAKKSCSLVCSPSLCWRRSGRGGGGETASGHSGSFRPSHSFLLIPPRPAHPSADTQLLSRVSHGSGLGFQHVPGGPRWD